ncbi:MAG: 4-hydroxy-3-methylbut-2-enyl diphosphate reductase [Puniceicoccales bacterium]|nr:4-hydroxy-3-methylbut-2-enyl diphosphate reductase [Puniceicoccales bacterium]
MCAAKKSAGREPSDRNGDGGQPAAAVRVDRCRDCGFCHGVRRAVGRAESLAAAGWNVFVDGELVHNGTVGKTLEKKNVVTWDGFDRRWGPRDCILIRAHGIGPERRSWLRGLGCRVFDATCPDVGRSAGFILRLRRRGYFLIFFGEENHPETAGLLAHGGKDIFPCKSADELAKITIQEGRPVAILAQTTAGIDTFNAFASRVLEKIPRAEVVPTICSSTRRRQEELLRRLETGSYDCAVIVGGHHSSNARNLSRLAASMAVPTAHVETAAELQGMELSKFSRILLASGASTPAVDVDAVERLLLFRGGAAAGGA